jgi:hypothetical protein
MEIDVEALKRDWTGFTFDTAEFEAVTSDLVSFAKACGELAARYTDPADPDFQAVPNYPSRYVGRRVLPDKFPRLGGGYGFDAGKCVTPIAPIRRDRSPSQMHDIYATGARDDALHRPPHGVPEPARRAGVGGRLAHGAAESRRAMSLTYDDVDLGAELPPIAPDVTLENVRRFTTAAGMTFGRFHDHDVIESQCRDQTRLGHQQRILRVDVDDVAVAPVARLVPGRDRQERLEGTDVAPAHLDGQHQRAIGALHHGIVDGLGRRVGELRARPQKVEIPLDRIEGCLDRREDIGPVPLELGEVGARLEHEHATVPGVGAACEVPLRGCGIGFLDELGDSKAATIDSVA